ncbi:cold shock domain-containing protein [Candidatus Nomurabacteria bacterium]|nr:cold shock domain-containing protein [Candidatus Nomurabacteria bacterium]
MKGSVVRKRDEGYGFIKPEEGEKDVFFHASSVVDITFDDLKEGDTVTFDVEEGPKGPAAANVTKAGSTAAAEAPADGDDDADAA